MNTYDLSSHQLVITPNPILEYPTSQFKNGVQSYRDALFNHMCHVMTSNHGVGLSANQIGLDASLFIMILDGKATMIINPIITKISDETASLTEGCLSDPGLRIAVKRPTSIEVRFEDINGYMSEGKMDGITARIFLHEFDHLNGIMISDRTSKLRLTMAKKKRDKKRRLNESME
jgi:peptide deformylase